MIVHQLDVAGIRSLIEGDMVLQTPLGLKGQRYEEALALRRTL